MQGLRGRGQRRFGGVGIEQLQQRHIVFRLGRRHQLRWVLPLREIGGGLAQILHHGGQNDAQIDVSGFVDVVAEKFRIHQTLIQGLRAQHHFRAAVGFAVCPQQAVFARLACVVIAQPNPHAVDVATALVRIIQHGQPLQCQHITPPAIIPRGIVYGGKRHLCQQAL